MSVAQWTQTDTERAQQIWAQYAADHDLSKMKGKAAGIDPASGRIWFGDSATDIVRQMKAVGEAVPLFFVRVGQDWYFRKGGRR